MSKIDTFKAAFMALIISGAAIAMNAETPVEAAQTLSGAPCYRPPGARPPGSDLTPERIQFEVATMFDAVYREGWMKPGAICYVFEDIQILPKRQRKLGAGYYDQPVHVRPVRMTVRVRIDRGRNGIDERVRGYGNKNTPRETFYFYLEDGSWNFKTGNP